MSKKGINGEIKTLLQVISSCDVKTLHLLKSKEHCGLNPGSTISEQDNVTCT